MSANPIPGDLRDFILATIDSVAEMEALLLLRSSSQQGWSEQFFAQRLYISDAETAAILHGLCDKGFAAAVAGEPRHYRYSPRHADLGALVDRLVDAYARHMIAVTHLIHSKPQSRLRDLASAFRFRKAER